VKDQNGNELARCDVNTDGTFDCLIEPKLADGTVVDVVIEDPAGNTTEPAVKITTDGVAPTPPVVNPSNGKTITGRVGDADLADAQGGDLTVVVTDKSGKSVCEAKVQADGTFRCDLRPALADGQEVKVTVKDAAGNVSGAVKVVADATAPPTPKPAPTAGETITGMGDAEGNTIVVKDANGNTLCTTTVGADFKWSCKLSPKAKVGDKVTVIESDPAGNAEEKSWRVGVPAVTIAKPTLCIAEPQSVTGVNFQPGETVAAVTTGGIVIGTRTANSNGQVVFNWNIPIDTPKNVLTLTLSGPDSGVYSVKYTVQCPVPSSLPNPKIPQGKLPFTGASGIVGMLGAALGALLAGLFLMMAAKRRRRSEEQAAA
jgi:hypothetical protein